jgi:hypothetical protein
MPAAAGIRKAPSSRSLGLRAAQPHAFPLGAPRFGADAVAAGGRVRPARAGVARILLGVQGAVMTCRAVKPQSCLLPSDLATTRQ